MHLGRALVRSTVEGNPHDHAAPRRGYRRVEWIEQALEPARGKLTRRQFELVSALSAVMGWEAADRPQRRTWTRSEGGGKCPRVCDTRHRRGCAPCAASSKPRLVLPRGSANALRQSRETSLRAV